MTEQANRIDWLERQLAQVRTFIDRDTSRLQQDPSDFAVELSLSSWKSHRDELQQELRTAKEALQREVVEMRLLGHRMDGSIPLRLLTKLSEKFNGTLAHAAYHLRYGQSPGKKGVPAELSDEIDLRLSGLAFGSTRLIFAGNMATDATGDSILEGALEQIFKVLAEPSPEQIRELVGSIGVKAARELSHLLEVLEKQQIGVELTWPAPDEKVYRWGGTLDAVRIAHHRLSAFTNIKPEAVTLDGRIAVLNESGAIILRSEDGCKIKVSYNKQQYSQVQQYTLGQQVTLKAMRYTTRDELTDKESSTYKLITDA